MNIKTKILILAVLMFASISMDAHVDPGNLAKLKDRVQLSGARMDCQPAESQIDMEINNVRARLLTGGDVWWNLQEGRYIVPKPAPGFPEVSALFAGGVWIGGMDPNDNIKLAGVTYRSGNATDFYAGPLDDEGESDLDQCENWDRFFVVRGEDIRRHIALYDESVRLGIPMDCDEIPESIKYWPGRGNPFWGEKYDFNIPDQNLGDFWDEPLSSAGYNPCEGDFPVIDIVGCEAETRKEARELLPDEIVFWLYNDKGGLHRLTQGPAIQMEVQVQSFAYATNDEVNDMTFYRYKLLNKATDYIKDCYFAMWTDPDLGCAVDDYIGCDVERSLAYIYNEDSADGDPGTSCGGGVETYKEDIPILGLDYFRGPREPQLFLRDGNDDVVLDENGNKILIDVDLEDPLTFDTLVELGMTSFVYQNNGGVGNPPPATTDPNNDTEYYNILRGLWRDGTAVTFGGSGYDPASMDSIKYVFPEAPNDDSGWSMCTADLPMGDRRTVQATGPLLLTPGAKNELILGVVFVPNIAYPCPEITRLQDADDLAQSLFNNCFDITDGPDAPDMYAVELDRQLVLILSNDSLEIESNNANELYTEADQLAPLNVDSLYRFEGYKIYQLANPNVTVQSLDDIDQARLIRQVDVRNGIDEIYNWKKLSNPDNTPGAVPDVFYPERQVNGADKGISHSFNVLIDQFANTDRRLVNHKNYYYTVLAYAHNEYLPFQPGDNIGQERAYLEGRRNVKTYTYTPRPVVYKDLQSAYGQEAEVTRLAGVGTGLNSLDLVDGTLESIMDGSIPTSEYGVNVLTYKAGNSPINPKIIDPLNIKDAQYSLKIVGEYNDSRRNPRIEAGEDADGTPNPTKGARWVLTNETTGQVIASEKSIEQINEQIIYSEGFSISVNQMIEPGTLDDEDMLIDETNGARTQVYSYADGADATEWFNAIPALSGREITPDENEPDETFNVYNFVDTEVLEDPKEELSKIDDGYFVPMRSTRWRDENGGAYITPSWKTRLEFVYNQSKLEYRFLNNVDIVFTSNKDLWSECVVVESAVPDYANFGIPTVGNANQFDLRESPSIDKEGNEIEGSMGKSYFPGYAIDVETGERLNIFFGENSAYSPENDTMFNAQVGADIFNTGNGSDMIWNPSTELFATGNLFNGGFYNNYAGGQHYIYVTRQAYDGCAVLHDNFAGSLPKKIDGVSAITWTGLPIPQEPLLSLADGLIPSDLTVKLRVANSFNQELDLEDAESTRDFVAVGGLPVYEFGFSGVGAQEKEPSEYESALDNVQVVPNPYYAYSAYEQNQFENIVKVTNLPPRAIVTIYTLDGKFIQQFNRDAMPIVNEGINPALAESQIAPALEWNLTNSKGVPVSSGVYIFHISAPTLGVEKSIKWFGINRRFDPTGL